jgi:hypothetical protein
MSKRRRWWGHGRRHPWYERWSHRAKIADDTVGTGASLDSAHARLVEQAISWLMSHPSQLCVFPKVQMFKSSRRRHGTESSKVTHGLWRKVDSTCRASSRCSGVDACMCGFSLLALCAVGIVISKDAFFGIEGVDGFGLEG